jgi:hypothetical protein
VQPHPKGRKLGICYHRSMRSDEGKQEGGKKMVRSDEGKSWFFLERFMTYYYNMLFFNIFYQKFISIFNLFKGFFYKLLRVAFNITIY